MIEVATSWSNPGGRARGSDKVRRQETWSTSVGAAEIGNGNNVQIDTGMRRGTGNTEIGGWHPKMVTDQAAPVSTRPIAAHYAAVPAGR